MKKKIMKKNYIKNPEKPGKLYSRCLLGAAALLTLPLLVGCQSADTPDVSIGKTTQTPHLLYYYTDNGDGLINTEGRMILPPDGSTNIVYYDTEGKQQLYIMQQTRIYDPERTNNWGEPLTNGSIITFYSTTGEVLHTLDLSEYGDITYYDRGSIDNSLLLCDNMTNDGTLKILKTDGTLILNRDLNLNVDTYGYCNLVSGDTWLALEYNYYDADYSSMIESGFEFYDMQGQPLTMDRNYHAVWEITEDGLYYRQPHYFQAFYETSQGVSLCDVLDRNGNVILQNLSDVSAYYDNCFVCTRGNERGLMDITGKWLYSESLFNELDD